MKIKKPNKINPGDVFQLGSGDSCVVIEYHSHDRVLIEHQDKNKHRAVVDSAPLRKGRIKNPYRPKVFGVGFFGSGDHKASVNGKMTPAYKTWRNMMRRAYCKDFHAEFPTYSECCVSSEWHDFQNFADWYYSQENNSVPGFDLDKDILYPGNKEYSKKTCAIIPRYINTLLMDCAASRGDLPQGVSFSKEKRLYVAQVKIEGKTTYIGRFPTPEEARTAYEKTKTKIVRDAAEKYKELIHPDIYENLKNWTL